MRAADFDAVIIPGGYAPDRAALPGYGAPRARSRAGRQIVAAICHAGSILVTADVLRGRTVTGFSSLEPDLRNAGAEYVDRGGPRRQSDHFGTPADPGPFCREVIAALQG